MGYYRFFLTHGYNVHVYVIIINVEGLCNDDVIGWDKLVSAHGDQLLQLY